MINVAAVSHARRNSIVSLFLVSVFLSYKAIIISFPWLADRSYCLDTTILLLLSNIPGSNMWAYRPVCNTPYFLPYCVITLFSLLWFPSQSSIHYVR